MKRLAAWALGLAMAVVGSGAALAMGEVRMPNGEYFEQTVDLSVKGKRPVTTPCPASRAVATSRAQSKEVRDVTGVEAGGLGEAGSGVRAQRAVAAGLVRRTWLERVFAGRMALPAAA